MVYIVVLAAFVAMTFFGGKKERFPEFKPGDKVWVHNPYHPEYHNEVEVIEASDYVYTGRLTDGRTMDFKKDDLSNDLI